MYGSYFLPVYDLFILFTVIFAMEKVFVCLFFNVVKFIHFFLFSIWIFSHHQKASISKPLLQMILESFAPAFF